MALISGKTADKIAELMGSLVHATLAIHEPPASKTSTKPGPLVKTFDLEFNPDQLSINRSADWKFTPAPNVRKTTRPEFLGTQPRAMSVEVFLDRSDDPDSNDVMKGVEALLACCQVTTLSYAADRPSPPWVVFQWGSFSTARFTAYVESVNASYTLFGTSGMPIRATCQLELREIPSTSPGQNPTSGALNAQRVHQVIAGDSLQSLAFQEYGDSNAWRAIAEANGIDDPSRLRTGDELVLPAAEQVRR